MITLDKLCEIFELAADASLKNKSGKLDDLIDAAYRAGASAVVRALETVIAEAYFTGLIAGEETDTKANHKAHAAFIVKSILGGAPTGDDGDDSKSTGIGSDMLVGAILPASPASFKQCAVCHLWGTFESCSKMGCAFTRENSIAIVDTSAASFCEWVHDYVGSKCVKPTCKNVDRANDGDDWPVRLEQARRFSYCMFCRKPIKFMADASTRKNEGEEVAKASSSPSATSAATVGDVFHDWFCGLKTSTAIHTSQHLARLKRKLLEAGYKILSREPTEEMIDTITYSPSDRILAEQNWRKLWNVAK